MVKSKNEPKKRANAGWNEQSGKNIGEKSSDDDRDESDDQDDQDERDERDVEMRRESPRRREASHYKRAERTSTEQRYVIKKKAKPGARALLEIKSLQKTTNLCIPRAPFVRVVSL